MSPGNRAYGLAPLSLLGTEPAELIRLAAQVGFDFVGLRILPVTSAEADLNLLPNSTRLAEVLTVLGDHEMPVMDIEFLALDGTLDRNAWLPVLESGARLGAASVTAAGCDHDSTRLTDTVLELAQDCREHDLRLNLEPISYQPMNSIPAAAALAGQADCWWLPDTLHLNRFGGTAGQLAQHSDRVGMLQLCDGPVQRPATREDLVEESRGKRGVPGHGEFDLVSLIQAVPLEIPLSAEVPDPRRRAEIGDRAWAQELLDSLKLLDRQAHATLG